MKNLKLSSIELKENFFTELSTRIDIDFCNYLDFNQLTDFDQLIEELENNNALNVEIIYYSNAIKYLQKNDPSLKESLELASDLGFNTDNLNSEVLASLLASENLRSEFYELENEINDFFESLED